MRKQFETPGGLTSVSISLDSSHIAAGCLDSHIYIWNVGSGALVHRLAGFQDAVYGVRFSPDGECLVAVSLDKSMKVWSTRDRTSWDLLGSMELHRVGRHLNMLLLSRRSSSNAKQDFVLSPAITTDCRWFLSASKDRSVIFWNAATRKPHTIVLGNRNSVIDVAVAKDKTLFATAGGDMRLRIWTYEVKDSV